MPLVNSTTGTPIPLFPEDSQAIAQMDGKIIILIILYS